MKNILLFNNRIKDFFNLWNTYGLKFAFNSLLWWICFYFRFPFSYKLSSYALLQKTKWLDDYLSNNYNEVISRYRFNPPSPIRINEFRIWVFWGQGRDNMPPVVDACYKQLTRYNKNVVLITFQNVHEYISLSPLILEKVMENRISWAHFSDIVRTSLLSHYGGLWLDATVWVPGPLPIDKLKQFSFFSANGKVIPSSRSIRFWTSYQWNWSTWCMGSNTSMFIIYSFVCEMLQLFATSNKYWPDYVLQDYLVYYACRNFPQACDAMEECNRLEFRYRNHLAKIMNSPFNDDIYKEITSKDYFFKLSFRTKWYVKTSCGKTTFFGRLIHNIK